jgi:RND superfamily putative drug exporter
VAILLDATIIRALVLPAAMGLLGNANWWAPRFLQRRTDRAWSTPIEGRSTEQLTPVG